MFILLMGIIFLILSFHLIKTNLKIKKEWIDENAEVVKHIESSNRSSHGKTMYYIGVKYEYKSETLINKIPNHTSNRPKKIGKKLKIYINPSNPKDIRQNSIFMIYLLPLLMLLSSLIMVLIGFKEL